MSDHLDQFTCKNCAWWKSHTPQLGACHIDPPQFHRVSTGLATSGIQSGWPLASADDFCSQWAELFPAPDVAPAERAA